MDKTPKGKSLRFVRPIVKKEDNSPLSKSNNCSTSTPIKESKKPRIWENDTCSQETGDIDVTWDWDSPKNIKPKILRTKKRELRKSPKVAPKKLSQIDRIKNFEKLREELQALRDEIARVDDDIPLLSPVDEQAFREESAKDCTDIDSFIEEQYFHIENQESESLMKLENDVIKPDQHNATIDEMFNDSCDEQLVLCTQMIEKKLNNLEPNVDINSSTVNNIRHNQPYDSNISEKIIGDGVSKTTKIEENKIDFRKTWLESGNMNTINFTGSIDRNLQLRSADDSFDAVLKEFEDEDIDILTQATNNTTLVHVKLQARTDSSFKRTISDANVQYIPQKNAVPKNNKFNFHRTHSFESAATSKKDDLPQHVIEEIERKRKEALARLKEKKEHQPSDSYSNISPMKCSPDEIEQKRLQAKAIREARQREIIEKNRQEALKRLEMSRQKRLEKVRNPIIKKN